MLKKAISLIISAVMLCGILNISVQAAAPIYFDGITTNVFEQDFGDISSTSEASDFAFSGNWTCTGEFLILPGTANGSIKTKNNIDLTGAYGYEYSVKTIMNQNCDNLFLAYNEANSNGYKVEISRKNSTISLYRAGSKTVLQDPNTVTVDYGSAHVWTARVEGKKLTITQDGTTVLEYTDSEAPSLKGIFGIESAADANMAVMEMKLDKLGEGVTVNNWRYEKDITAKDTTEGLAADGLTFTTSNSVTPTFSNSYMEFAKPGNNVNVYYDKKISGDFNLDTQIATYYSNPVTIRFNRDSAGNYYAISYQGSNSGKNTNNFKIVKYTVKTDTAAATTTVLEKMTLTTGTNVKYSMNIKENESGITVTASILNTSGTVQGTLTTDIAKEELFEETHRLRLNMSAAGNHARLYYFNVYSTPSGETKTRDVSVINKEFATGDTVTSLKNEGINLSITPTSITDVTHWKDWKGYDGLYWNEYNSSGSKYKAYATTAEKFSGDYTFSATTKVYQNYADIIVNSQSTSTDYWTKGAECYYIHATNSALEIQKKNTAANDVTTLKTIKYKKADGTELTKLSDWSGYAVTTTVDVINNVDGSITIKAKAVQLHTGYTAEDEVTDSTSPYTSGYCRVAFSNATGEFRNLYDMKLTKHETYVDEGEYEGRFYINGTETVNYEKDEIYFETPVVDLGTYTAVAALYEDNEMTGLKTFTPREMCEGKLRLFNTTGSTAAQSYVKVYFLDSSKTLNKTMNVWTLR